MPPTGALSTPPHREHRDDGVMPGIVCPQPEPCYRPQLGPCYLPPTGALLSAPNRSLAAATYWQPVCPQLEPCYGHLTGSLHIASHRWLCQPAAGLTTAHDHEALLQPQRLLFAHMPSHKPGSLAWVEPAFGAQRESESSEEKEPEEASRSLSSSLRKHCLQMALYCVALGNSGPSTSNSM